jgi:hypothetical protein
MKTATFASSPAMVLNKFKGMTQAKRGKRELGQIVSGRKRGELADG